MLKARANLYMRAFVRCDAISVKLKADYGTRTGTRIMLEGTAGFATATLKSQKGAGLFVLDVASNHIFADSAVAEVFGFSPSATENGLPLDD